eukprot:gene10497-8463_t
MVHRLHWGSRMGHHLHGGLCMGDHLHGGYCMGYHLHGGSNMGHHLHGGSGMSRHLHGGSSMSNHLHGSSGRGHWSPAVLTIVVQEYEAAELRPWPKYIRCPIYTLCIGQAASMASLLLSAGEKGQRRCLPNARIMLHQPMGAAEVGNLVNTGGEGNPVDTGGEGNLVNTGGEGNLVNTG